MTGGHFITDREIKFDYKGNDDKYEESTKIIRALSEEYNTRLKDVTIGAKKAAGEVTNFGALMRLNSRIPDVVIHEFAHTLADTNTDRLGLTHDQAFWKEIKKVQRKYHKDVDKVEDTNRWISCYEHSNYKRKTGADEFFAEAFTHAKMKELGIDIPSKYGTDFTYSQKVLDITDKYFNKSVAKQAKSDIILKRSIIIRAIKKSDSELIWSCSECDSSQLYQVADVWLECMGIVSLLFTVNFIETEFA